MTRYEVLGRAGRGAMAESFLTRVTTDDGIERRVVLRRVMFAQSARPFVDMLFDEALVISRYAHPNILAVYEIGRLAGAYFFTTEFSDSIDAMFLLERLAAAKQVLPVEHAAYITSCVARALHDAHERIGPDGRPLEILHRGVAPQRIMVGRDGRVALCDFGVAKAAELIERDRGVRGKYAYLSPEQCKGKKLDRRSDLFVLGIVFHELLTTRKLFRRDSDFEILKAIVAVEVDPPSRSNPALFPQHDAIAMKALAAAPADRYQTGQDFVDALEPYVLRDGAAALSRFLSELVGPSIDPWLAPPAFTFTTEMLANPANEIHVLFNNAPII